jgi:ribosomal-protein-alanine N-acetyltransferase
MARDALPRGWSIELFQVDRDLDGVMAVDEASFVNPWTRDMFLWEAHHSDVSRLFVCRDAAGTVVAYCATWVVFDELHINNLAVLPAWRRRGVAAALLSVVLESARRAGASRATLEVRESNAAAIALYAAFGFVPRGRRPRYYAKPEEDALILWRETGPGSVETPRDE